MRPNLIRILIIEIMKNSNLMTAQKILISLIIGIFEFLLCRKL